MGTDSLFSGSVDRVNASTIQIGLDSRYTFDRVVDLALQFLDQED